MNQCHYCHEPIGDVKFCSNCGQAQQCLSCGKDFEGGECFCTQCGTAKPTGDVHNENVNSAQRHEGGEAHQQANPLAQSVGEIQQTPHTTGQSHQNGNEQKQPMTRKQMSIISSIVGVLAIIIIYFVFFTGPNTPEEVVEAFFDAVSDQDERKVRKYIDPIVHSEVDFSYMPKDATFSIVRFDEVSIAGNEAFVDVTVRARSVSENINDTEWFYVYLEKRDGDWIIYDMY